MVCLVLLIILLSAKRKLMHNEYLFKLRPSSLNKMKEMQNLDYKRDRIFVKKGDRFDYRRYYENDYKRGFYNLDRSRGKYFSKFVKVKIIRDWIKKYNINKNVLLDAGGGTGTYGWYFMKDFKKVIVSDISKKALDTIPEKEIKKVNCNILHHPLKSESIDCILLIDVFEHIKEEELKILMKEMNRLLKKNSFVIIYSSLYGWGRGSIYNRLFNRKRKLYIGEEEMGHLNRLTFKEYKDLFTKTKFKIIDYFYYSIFFQPFTDIIKDNSAILLDKIRSKFHKNKGNNEDWSEQRKGQDIKEKIRENNQNPLLKGVLYFFSLISYLDILIFGKILRGNSIFFLLEKEEKK